MSHNPRTICCKQFAERKHILAATAISRIETTQNQPGHNINNRGSDNFNNDRANKKCRNRGQNWNSTNRHNYPAIGKNCNSCEMWNHLKAYIKKVLLIFETIPPKDK